MLLLYGVVTAQQTDDYRYYKLYEPIVSDEKLEEQAADTVVITNSTELWYRSLFDKSSVVVCNRYGVGYYDRRLIFNGITIPKIGDSRLARLAFERYEGADLHSDYISVGAIANNQTSVGVNLTTRSYLGGVTLSTAHQLSEKWSLCSDIYIRGGRDSHIQGVFTSEASISASATYKPDSLNSLSLLLLFTPSERATRKASVNEAFTLTGNHYYNPSWGYQAGKVRSANLSKSLLPTLVGSYNRELTERSDITLSLALTAGQTARGSIDWLNTQTPLPDNYRYLPSYYDHPIDIAAATQSWVDNDSRYTQIDFDGLCQTNRLFPESIYLTSDRVTRTADTQLCAIMQSRVNDALKLYYGAKALFSHNRHFKQITDLLGSNEFTDIDYFLVDDKTLFNSLNNDMQHPGRKVGVADRYSYDYALDNIVTKLFAAVEYHKNRLSLLASAEVGAQWVSRVGFFQKEIFANSSLGRSRVLGYAPWSLSGEAKFYISPQQTIFGSLSATAVEAEPQMEFLQTEYNNRPIDNPNLAKRYTFTAGYSLKLHKLALRAQIFANYNNDMHEVAHLYHDAYSTFSDVVTDNISTIAAGVEAEVHYDFAYHWQAALAASFGKYCYTGAPTITVYADTDNSLLSTERVAAAKGLNTGTTPQITSIAQVGYHNRGWRAAIEAEYHALRYYMPSLIRRTEDILSHTATKEVREQFISQQRLGNAFAVNLTLSKSFYLNRFDRREYISTAAPRFIDRHPRSRISVFLAVNNILGNNNIVYRGYETSRINKRYLWQDFQSELRPSYLLYAYPRTYYLQVKFTF